MSRIRIFIILTLFLISGLAFDAIAQVDTVLDLTTIEVQATSLRNDIPGVQQEYWNPEDLSKYQSEKLSTLLEQESGVYIKSYGLGSSATTSIRGGSSSQTSVIWNGFPLQSPMLGQLDFSLMPLGLVEEVGLQYGGASDSWGSGAVGGSVQLNNKPISQDGLTINWNGEFGAFDQHTHLLNTQYRKGRLAGSSRVFYHRAQNDFEYRTAPGQAGQKLEHAAIKQKGALQELYWQASPGEQFSWRLWLQETERELPPTTVQSFSLASQQDAFLRSMLAWEKSKGNIYWQSRLGLFREALNYQDELILLETNNRFTTIQGEIEADWYINNRQRWHWAISDNWVQATTNNYDEPIRQNRLSVQTHFRQEWKRWKWQLGGRVELIDQQMAPFIPSLGVEYTTSKWWQINARILRSYRLPTLNDLYWSPGGNPDLAAEQGWSEELGATFRQKIKKINFEYQFTAFNRNIENWILWSPSGAGAFWSAQNLTEVWSRGIEQRVEAGWKKDDWTFMLKAGYDFIRSTNEVAISTPKINKGQQLAYVPRHQFYTSTQINWNGWELNYLHRYIGKVTAVNIEEVPGYQLGNLRIAYHTLFRESWKTILYLRINNLWDAEYRIVERRPMPGRYFQLGIQLMFKKL